MSIFGDKRLVPKKKSRQYRVDDQSTDTLISGHLAFQNEKAPDLHFWTIAGAVQFGLAHKI